MHNVVALAASAGAPAATELIGRPKFGLFQYIRTYALPRYMGHK
jgi:hypothetical protein